MIRTILDALLNRTIFLSFDRSRFLRHARSLRPGDLDVDLTGRVCLVTGANSGIRRGSRGEMRHVDHLDMHACAPGRLTGRFWLDRAAKPTHLLPFTIERPRDRARLWRTCTQLAGLAPASEDPRSAPA